MRTLIRSIYKMSTIQPMFLNDGSTLPSVAFGTVNVKGARGLYDTLHAIDNGYRLIDTSTNYNNEGMVGEAVKRSAVPREELLISSKLRSEEHTSELQSRFDLVC